jgi:hypothetical protein
VFDDVLSGVAGVSRCSDIPSVQRALTAPAPTAPLISTESSAAKWVELILG